MQDIAGDLQDHVKGLRRYAMALCGDPSEADDLVQETLKRALTYARNGRRIRNLRPYLFTILHNVRVDSAVKGAKLGNSISLDDSPIEIPYAASQESHVECRELADALRRLPEQQREVLLLIGLEGLSYQGAADILDVPIGTVMSRLNRGRAALRQLMASRESGDKSCRAAHAAE